MARVENESSEEENNDVEVIIEDEDEGGEDQDIGDDDTEITSESDDNDLAEEVALEREAEQLTVAIEQDPYNYEHHSKLIKTLHQLHDLERLRKAFESLRSRAVPDSDLWLRRLNIEVLLAHTEQQRKEIEKLFAEATIDCYSAELHAEWIRCRLSWCGEPVSDCGPAAACPLTGHVLHATCIEHTKELIGNKDSPEYSQRVKMYATLLEDALARPLMGIGKLLTELGELNADMIACLEEDYVDRVKAKYDIAKELLQALLSYEDKLLSLESNQHDERVQHYTEYIDYVYSILKDEQYKTCHLKDVLLVLFDRAAYECMSSASLTSLFDKILNLSKDFCSIDEQTRLLRICARRGPRRGDYFIKLMEHIERNGGRIEEIKNVLESSLAIGLESVKDYERVWWAYLTFLRRKTDWKNGAEVERLRDTLKLAWDSLGETWGDEADTECRILQFWARMEYEMCSDQSKGRQVVEQMLLIGGMKHRCTSWQFLIGLERCRGAPTHKIRAIYERAIRHVTDYPPSLLKEYVDFERLYGTLDEVIEAEKVCKEKTEEWRNSFDAQKQQKGKQPSHRSGKRNEPARESSMKGMKRRMNDDGDSGRKRSRDDGEKGMKRKANVEDEASGSKKARNAPVDDSAIPRTLFVSNLPHKVDEESLRSKLSEFGEIESLRLVMGVKAFGGSIAYCTYQSNDSLEKALEADRTPFSGRPMFLSRAKSTSSKDQEKLKFSTSREKHKLFVKGIPFSHCTRPKLTELFGSYGGLKDVRVVTFKDGKPKGLAYIEYENVESSTKALEATNGIELEGRKIVVAFSDPPIRQPTSSGASERRPQQRATANEPPHQAGAMKRTKLSCLLPRVLAVPGAVKASTSSSQNGHQEDKTAKPMSNADFRSMLLKK